MAEPLSPRQRGTMSNRLQSPTRQFFLGSNNDQLERAQERAARAAAIRRKAAATIAPPPPDDTCLSEEQIVELFQNCIKLASENKINQKNTWELRLIDHLSEIIKVETVEGDSETNFQKASCTLEAGVKIYSVRVDAVHAEAYKVLGGINRAGQEDEQDTITAGENVDNRSDGGHSTRESERKISPVSMLESSFEALNMKKFDAAFSVDPLYHQTSAQFDEGGAIGLLLNNLGVYGGCQVLFDSFEVPGKCESDSLLNNDSDMIDLSFAKEFVEQMVINMCAKPEISPTLEEIICHFDEDNQRSQTFSLSQNIGSRLDVLDATTDAFDAEADRFGANGYGLNDNSFGYHEVWNYDHDGGTSVVNEISSFGPFFHGDREENDPYAAYEPGISDRFEDVTMFLFQGLGFSSKQNAWAGPDHWKYQKSKGSGTIYTAASGSACNAKKRKKKTQVEDDIDFRKSLDEEIIDIFAPPRTLKSLLLPANRSSNSNSLPEDCHYQHENLVKLFLLPNVLCTGKRRRKLSDNNSQQQDYDNAGALPSWDNESVVSDQYDDGYVPSDMRDSDGLISRPRQVDKDEVQYDKTSKQVDVHALKEALWDCVHEITEVSGTVGSYTVSFRHVLATLLVDCPAAAAARKGISPRLCFICLLHLANEHGLIIRDCPSLDDLSIHLPSAQQNTDREVNDSS
ncbi:Condensin complex subunit 2 [Melia azedarach]|uniref:Condensin complex subunit 2 n=1 Tax=Melia azedarach TaxID=155640 RepID=A0ACC1YNP9_MELAZ|nr:Condensin complex subunit 2 [Melia azedarach]